MNRKILTVCALFLALCLSVFAQYTDTHKNFLLGSIYDKVTIIESASRSDTDLLAISLRFCIDSSPVLSNSKELNSLLLKTLSAFGDEIPQSFSPLFLEVYKTFPSREVYISLFPVMARSSVTDVSLLRDIYAIISEESHKHFSQRSNELLTAAVKAAGSASDSLLFTNLFPCLFLDLDNEVTSVIIQILSESIQRYKADCMKIIAGGSIGEQRAVFNLVVKSDKTDDFFKAEIAESILSSTITTSGDAQNSRQVIDLQLDSMRVIRSTKWTRSSLLIAKYFTAAQEQYKQSLITRDEFLEVIDCLTDLATSETGKALTEYLGILNDNTDKTGTYDEVLLLQVIRSIGKLGEKSAFDNLLYVILYKGYSETVINASKEALAKLNW